MPLTLNVGLSKKIGLPNFGSLGASCTVQVELDAGLLQHDLEAFHRQVRSAYAACAQAVDDEPARHQQAETPAGGNGRTQPSATNDNASQRRTNGRKATASQIRAIHAIVNRQGFDLAETLRGHGVEFAEDLSISEASQLIDDLKARPNGSGGRR